MKRRALGFALLLAACGGGGGNKQLGNTVAPTGPAPTIAWNSDNGTLTGVPLASSDGSVIVVDQTTGGGGPQSTTLVQKDRSDAVVHEEPVSVQDDSMDEPVDSLAKANAYLATLHGTTDLSPVPAAEVTSDGDSPLDSTKWAAHSADGVDVAFDLDGHVVITAGGAALVDHVMDAWLATAYPMCPDGSCEEMCSNPPMLDGAWVDGSKKLAILRVSYVGNDSCWEPDSVSHVVTW